MSQPEPITFFGLSLSAGATISPFVWATKSAIVHKGLELEVVSGGFIGILDRTGGRGERLPVIVDRAVDDLLSQELPRSAAAAGPRLCHAIA